MKNLEEKSRFYKALGEPIRLKIIGHLIKKEQCTCICELSKLLKRDQSVISRHIQILKEADILDTNKEAKYLLCCIKDKTKIKKLLREENG
ncbi:metalloregulator ArsR/SmtB family transcription factor [Candidatus Woesearchaeota archaeon]|nr:metalloregulator ArsR/SmtB family transcription factor [Candidatus Woesearchaeota archaeon]